MTSSNSAFHRFCRTVADWEWLFLALMLPFVLAVTPQRALVLLLIPLLWLVRKVGYGRFFEKTPVDWAVWGLVGMVLVSLVTTDDWLSSLPKVVGLLYGVALFYTAVAYTACARTARSPSRLWWVVGLLLACGLLVVGIALVGVRWTSKFEQIDAVFALLPARLLELSPDEQGISPNEVAGVLLWVLPVGLALSLAILRHPRALFTRLRGWAIPTVLFVWTAVLAMLMVLVLTQSRAGLLGFVAGLGVMVFIAAGRFRWWLVAMLGVLLLVGGTAVWQTQSASQIAAIVQAQAGERGLETMQGRAEIWERAVAGIQDFPLTGMGMNRFRELVFAYYPTFFLNSDTDFAHAHNQFLQTGLDLGLPGLVFYIALWLGLAAMIKVAWSQTASVWLRALATGAAGALAAYFVYGLVDAVALGAKPGFIFWLLLGVIAALYRQVVDGER